MSKNKRRPQSLVAKGMILAKTGLARIFKAKQDHRAKDYRNSWQKEVKDELL